MRIGPGKGFATTTTLPAGTPLHGMWIRLTVDDDMLIHACEAASDHTPYAVCPQAAPNFARLAGLTIGPERAALGPESDP